MNKKGNGFDCLFAKCFGQFSGLGIALIGYRQVMRAVQGFEGFWWFDGAMLVLGVFVFLFFELGELF